MASMASASLIGLREQSPRSKDFIILAPKQRAYRPISITPVLTRMTGRIVIVLWRVHWHSRPRRDVHWSSLRCRRPQSSNGPSWWRDNRASRPSSLWPWTRPPNNVANSRPWRPSGRCRYQGRPAAACSGRSRCRSFWSSPSSVVCSS